MDPGTKKAEAVHTLLTDLFAELRNINVVWEIGVVALSLTLAWWISRGVHSRFIIAPTTNPDATSRSLVRSSMGLVVSSSRSPRWSSGAGPSPLPPHSQLAQCGGPLLFSLMLVRVVVHAAPCVRGCGPRNWERAIGTNGSGSPAYHRLAARFTPAGGFGSGSCSASDAECRAGLLAVAVTVIGHG
jgi:hypothetical protein